MFSLVNDCFTVAFVVEEEIGVLLHKSLHAFLLMAGGQNAPNRQKREKEMKEQANKQPQDMKEH